MVNFTINDGVLEKYSGDESEIRIPEGVEKIGDRAFSWCSSLTSIYIPEGVKKIGDYAFYGCSSLISANIPEGVKSIGDGAFEGCSELTDILFSGTVRKIGQNAFKDCSNLESIEIPAGVKRIGEGAFDGCTELTDISIPDGVSGIDSFLFSDCNVITEEDDEFFIIGTYLLDYFGDDPDVVIPNGIKEICNTAFDGRTYITGISIPDSVSRIGFCAFRDCENLTRINIPRKVTSIDLSALSGCKKLENIVFENDRCNILFNKTRCESWNDIDSSDDISLTPQMAKSIHSRMKDPVLAKFILSSEIWDELSPEVQADIFLNRRSEALQDLYKFSNPVEIGVIIAKEISKKPSPENCDAAASFAGMYYSLMPKDLTEKIYNGLKAAETGEEALGKLESIPVFIAFLHRISDETNMPAVEAERKVLENLIEQGVLLKTPELDLKKNYGLDPEELAAVKDTAGNTVSAIVLPWLLTVQIGEPREQYVLKPGIRSEVRAVVDLLDPESFQQALIKIADDHLGRMGKESDLAYPICRYADEKTMEILTKRALQWSSKTSGKNAPALRKFRAAAKYSTTRAAMLFAEKYGDLDDYAKIRGMDEDAVRDQIIADTGLDANRSKTYDLGNQIVKVHLQKDLHFTVVLPDGKTVKSLPKKNADPEKYAAANEDFSGLKKNIKKIIKNRINSLFDDFLSGRTRNAESWKGSYLGNPLLRDIACLLVWQQGNNTFTLTETDVIDSAGNPYSFTDEDVCLAYPAEMDAQDLSAWQDYFTANHLKQPFLQIWEPVRKLSEVESDRYKGIEIPYYRFLHQEKHGITIDASYDGQWIDYDFKGLNVNLEQLDYSKYWNHLEPDSLFEIKEIKPDESSYYKRYANHIIVYLDRIMIRERIQKDDTQIIDFLPRFTAAQISEFISVATEANAVNVTAMLLEYKSTHYPDLDPLAEFTLDFL